MLSQQLVLCVVPTNVNIMFSSCSPQKCFVHTFFFKFLTSLESPDKRFLLVAVTPLLSHCPVLNPPKFLGVPIAKNPEDLGQMILEASLLGSPRYVH